MLRLIIAISVLFGTTVARAASPVAEIPYRIDYGGWFTVSGTIKGQGPFDFVVDTGATRTLIFKNTVEKIGGVTPVGDERISVIGLLTSTDAQAYDVGDISIGGLASPRLGTVVLDDWVVDGRAPQAVLGLDFLSGYHVEFDAVRHVMRLYAQTTPYAPPSRKWKSAKISRKKIRAGADGLYTTTVRLNDAAMPFMIDLGATGTIVNRAGARRAVLGNGIAIDTAKTPTRITDALDTEIKAGPTEFQDLRVGKTAWRRVVLTVYDAPVIAELGLIDEPFGIIGANLFAGRSFAFDFANGKLFIAPPS